VRPQRSLALRFENQSSAVAFPVRSHLEFHFFSQFAVLPHAAEGVFAGLPELGELVQRIVVRQAHLGEAVLPGDDR
jgi:hypothetical protein